MLFGRRGWGAQQALWTHYLHHVQAKSNNRTRDQFERDVTWFCFLFRICSHARCSCCSIVCLRFQVVQIKDLNNYKENTFRDIFEQLHTHRSIKPQKRR